MTSRIDAAEETESVEQGDGPDASAGAVLKERVVYVGRRVGSTGKIAHWYMPVSREGSLYGSLKRYSEDQGIGAVLEISRPPDQPTSTYVTGEHAPRVVDVWLDEADLAEWRVLDRAEYQQSVAAARVRKGLRDMPDEFEDALRVLTRHFARLNHSQRAALLPLVQARVLGGGGL